MFVIAILALIAQDKPYEGELRERLNAPPKAILTSVKPSYDLEICVADALTVIGTPTVLRDGPDNIVIAAAATGGNAFLAAVSIIKNPTGSRIELRIRGKAWDDRIRTRVAGCL